MAGLLIVTTGSAASPAPREAIFTGDPGTAERAAARGPVESDDAVLLEGPADLTGEMVEAGGLLFVTTREGAGGWSLWRTDGTSEGTRRLAVCRSVLVCGWSAPPMEWGAPLVAVGDLVYVGTSQGLWRSDGTDAGTFMIAKDADMNDRDRRPREPQGAERRRMSDEVCDLLVDGSRLLIEASVDCMDP